MGRKIYAVYDQYQQVVIWMTEEGEKRAAYTDVGERIFQEKHLDGSDRLAAAGHFSPNPIITDAWTEPGFMWPRIYHPSAPRLSDKHRKARDSSVHAARVLFKRLEDVFRYVEPEGANLQTYGHEIRNLLILACTEVENGWKAVLSENGYPLQRRKGTGAPIHWNRNDYIKVKDPLQLADWEVSLMGHRGVRSFWPFRQWAAGVDNSLPWYDDYNGTKHDRENAFASASLETCIEACAAVFIMVSAQFGPWSDCSHPLHLKELQLVNTLESATATTFRIESEPNWRNGGYPPPKIDPHRAWGWGEAFRP